MTGHVSGPLTGHRVLLYVQHLLGIGHLRRAAILARALAAAGLRVDLVSGGMPLAGLELGGARLWQLPPARTLDDGRWALVDGGGREVDEAWRGRRRARLLEIFKDSRPDALVVEMFPFGRRQMAYELTPLLEAARAARPAPLVVCSVRDVLQVNRKPGRSEAIAATVDRLFDKVLVHGDPRVLPFEASFDAAARIANKLHYTGYVADVPAPGAGGAAPAWSGVLVSAGGGAVGRALLETAVAARPRSRLGDRPWHLLAGANLPAAAFEALRQAAGAGVRVERARRDFARLLAGCAVSVSQGGYNTVMDALAADARAVVVPFAGSGETEQTMRAERLAELGLLRLVPESALTPEALAGAVDRAAASPRPSETAVRLDLAGAAASARLLCGWLAAGPAVRPAALG